MSISDGANRLIADHELSAYGGHRQWSGQHPTNYAHIRNGQFGCGVEFTDRVALLSGAIGIVFALGASKQMARIYARRVIALVKNAQACVQVSINGFIHEAMGSYLAPIVVVNDAVAFAVCTAGPQPTIFWASDKWKVFHHANFNRWRGSFPSRVRAFLRAELHVLFGHLLAAMFTVARGIHLLIICQQQAGSFGL